MVKFTSAITGNLDGCSCNKLGTAAEATRFIFLMQSDGIAIEVTYYYFSWSYYATRSTRHTNIIAVTHHWSAKGGTGYVLVASDLGGQAHGCSPICTGKVGRTVCGTTW